MVETITIPYVSKFEEFFSIHYKSELEKIAEFYPKKRSLEIDYKVLETYDTDLADELIEKPYAILQAARDAIVEMKALTEKEEFKPNVRFFNLPSDNNFLVRNINSDHLNKFIAVDGIITKITEVRPKLIVGVFECTHCGKIYSIPQEDQMGSLTEPTICACERRAFRLLTEQSTFIDSQKLEMQEPLELLRGGEQAKKISAWLEDDLTNRITPGDKIQLTGALRLKPPKFKRSEYDIYIDVNHVLKLEKEFEELELNEDEIKKIKELSKDPKLYPKIIASIAPSIYGLDGIKEAIALQLFGGTPGKVKSDGMKIRPDMHILLIGDPGTGKSQLLMYVTSLATKSLYVSGKASTGAGLTATAERDELADGGWTLKAGALVLAAGGHAMIDEFDKMSDEDRSSMHEAMEAQQIHVAKAGMIATFKANTSILAAANPKYGRFDPFEPPASQFDIPPTIMSRFDLIFPVKDTIDTKRDSEMAEHIAASHYISGVKASNASDDVSEYEKRVTPAIEPDLLRKYIAYARKNIKPVLSKESIEKVKSFYLDLRKIGEKQGTIPITPRYLEAVIRLAEASAKGRLSNRVQIEDAERAVRLLKYCLKEVGIDPETGRMDIDMIATGIPRSKTDRIRTVLKIIKKLNQQYEEARHEAILEETKAEGVSPDDLDEILNTLKKNGDIYSPKYGVYKPTEER